MGAKAVFIDHDTLLWGLARDGHPNGLKEMLTMLNEELKLAMVLTSCEDVSQITAERIIEWIQPKPH